MTDIIIILALLATAAVGLDLALRPERHVRASADRVAQGRAVPFEALSHRLLPRFESPGAYRLIGFAIVIFAAAFAAAYLTGFLGE